jgi:MFS family permease
MFRALRVQKFRRIFFAQLGSLSGTWLQSTTMAFYAYEKTSSVAVLGKLAVATGLPVLLLIVPAGIVADHYSRKKIILATQCLMLVCSVMICLLFYVDQLSIPVLIGMSSIMSSINAFDTPIRISMPANLVDRSTLRYALSLNASMYNLAAALGPAIGGLIYHSYGAGVCLALNAVSFMPLIVAIYLTTFIDHQFGQKAKLESSLFFSGFDHFRKSRLQAELLGLLALTSFFIASISTLFPSWAKDVLGGDARIAGYLTASRGLGAACGALFLGYTSNRFSRGQILTGTPRFLVLILILFAFFGYIGSALICCLALGIGQILVLNTVNTVIQESVSEPDRGKVTSIVSLAFFGLIPAGGAFISYLSQLFGQTVAILTIAISFGVLSAWIIRHSKLASIK